MQSIIKRNNGPDILIDFPEQCQISMTINNDCDHKWHDAEDRIVCSYCEEERRVKE